ncbi:hypothetical protein TL16_g05010 [Triparma laevis f. inornata]|uniref:Enoyl-CoA hydratase n=2 Tax=Triparma laevis TaxID=1534972 RepID=A0A9W7AIQ2_9STRA|nr:hypothetical protein TL16_g05010 [Triparma laevis f. inornata]GMH73002.1 hypothetical protein TrLO_g14117 [Triparma laevis f. longispina]
MNSLNVPMWAELIDAFDAASRDSDVRVCVLKGEGKHFSAGMDLAVFAEMRKIADEEACEGRKREKVYNSIDFFQRSVTAPEACTKPVLCSMQGAVIGGAVDLATACDIRYVHNKAQLSVKEIDLAIVADVGTMQRLPHIVGDQRARELTYTGRTFSGAQAVEYGLALEGFDSSDDLDSHVMSVASEIATKSPLTIRGIKKVAVYTRDHNTDDALLHVAQHNSAMLFSEDLDAAMAGMMAKKEPVYRGN